MTEQNDGYTELLTLEQVMAGQEAHGTPTRTDLPVPRHDPVAGPELAKHRVKVSFVFDVVCNDRPVRNASDDQETIAYDLALLKSFLKTDKEGLLHMMVDTIGTQLGLNSPESFVALFFPQIVTESNKLFNKAIDELCGDEGKHWRELRDGPVLYHDWFGYCIDDLCSCFSAEFVKSSFEILEDSKDIIL